MFEIISQNLVICTQNSFFFLSLFQQLIFLQQLFEIMNAHNSVSMNFRFIAIYKKYTWKFRTIQ